MPDQRSSVYCLLLMLFLMLPNRTQAQNPMSDTSGGSVWFSCDDQRLEDGGPRDCSAWYCIGGFWFAGTCYGGGSWEETGWLCEGSPAPFCWNEQRWNETGEWYYGGSYRIPERHARADLSWFGTSYYDPDPIRPPFSADAGGPLPPLVSPDPSSEQQCRNDIWAFAQEMATYNGGRPPKTVSFPLPNAPTVIRLGVPGNPLPVGWETVARRVAEDLNRINARLGLSRSFRVEVATTTDLCPGGPTVHIVLDSESIRRTLDRPRLDDDVVAITSSAPRDDEHVFANCQVIRFNDSGRIARHSDAFIPWSDVPLTEVALTMSHEINHAEGVAHHARDPVMREFIGEYYATPSLLVSFSKLMYHPALLERFVKCLGGGPPIP